MLYEKPIKPMMATSHDQPFDSADYLYEVKWDGYRCLAYCGREIKLYSRAGLELTQHFPSIVAGLKTLSASCIVDGEIIALDSQGLPSFSLLQANAAPKNHSYILFDLLFCDSHVLLDQPLIARRQRLSGLLDTHPLPPALSLSLAVEEQGKDFFSTIDSHGLEGMMAKKKESRYYPGIRSKEWLKIKTIKETDGVISGYLPKTGGFKSLVLAQYVGHDLSYVGCVGTGFTQAEAATLLKGLRTIRVSRCPFATIPLEVSQAVWVQPLVVVTVRYLQYTSSGKLRHPSFVAIRNDKLPQECQYQGGQGS